MSHLLAIFVYLISCGPGGHVYSQYGHTAIRVLDTDYKVDVCFNYGFFSFHSDHFYRDFIKGSTYYELLVEATEDFYTDCLYEGREVQVQELNIDQARKLDLIRALFDNARPENKSYLYNFVFDNCATRPFRLIKRVLGDSLTSNYKGAEGKTYRQFLHHYNRPGSWADLGINLIFGPKADKKMNSEERLFIPEELMFYINEAVYSDGKPLVKPQSVHPFTVKPVVWYKTWYLGLVAYILLLGGLTFWDRRRQKLSLAVDFLVAAIYLLFLVLVGYLTFFSLHPLVGFSWRLIIFPLVHLCVRSNYFLR